ncbi:DUF1634 domain-containing protein [Mucilaginibacter agri]|uniref:DUF1634 domain-containing protein n=1 Tax=Mucilaginibacter agri TaxID=2695265 RepID=A0A965ZHM2_9SPHI|nr:DUF1634 domain-containing protein [Mucilaginibacter agri]NCD70139.1 DUF1634 domain-containing protein [Mucilaginibacter agri]
MKNDNSRKLTGDHDIEQFIGMQLRVGVIGASLIVLIGGIFYMLQLGGSPVPAYHHFVGTEAGFTTAGEVLSGLRHGSPKGIIQAGIIVLIATPILRIAFSLLGFILEKDRMYTGITIIVLAVMLFSIFGGLKV